MKLSVLACLAVCLAVAVAVPIGLPSPVITSAKTLSIDVTSDFVDSQQTQHIFQVAIGVEVAQGSVLLNGVRVGSIAQTAVEFSALFREVASNGQIVNAHNVKVGVQAVVQLQASNDGSQTLSVQLLLNEVDGSLLTQVAVHEVVIFLNAVGQETSRKVNVLPLTQSRITTAATTAAPLATSAPTADSSSDSSSDETPGEADINHDHDHDHDGEMEKCRVRRFFHWVGKQSFGVRVLIYAILALLFILTLKFLFCLVSMCCCSRPQSRTTYLNNVKLHYVPLSLDDDDEKKPMLI